MSSNDSKDWQKNYEIKRAQEARRAERRIKNHALFDAVQDALSEYPRKLPETLLASIEKAIEAGGDPNAKATLATHGKTRPLGMVMDAVGKSPLAMDVLHLLVKHGADLNARTSDKNTWLHRALRGSWLRRPEGLSNLQTLLDAGLTAHLGLKNADWNTPLDVLLSNSFVPESEKRRAAKVLIDAGARLDDSPSLLANLMMSNKLNEFNIAVELGMDPTVRQQGKNLWTTWATSCCSEKTRYGPTPQAWMDRLLALNVDPHVVDDEQRFNKEPTTALMLALNAFQSSYRMDEACVKGLLDHGVAYQNKDGSPLFAYAAYAKTDHLETLHRLGVDLTISDAQGETLLHTICQADLRSARYYKGQKHEAHDTVELLLAAGCNPNAISQKSKSPLYMAVMNRTSYARFDRLRVAQALITAGAEPSMGGMAGNVVPALLYPHNVPNEAGQRSTEARRFTQARMDGPLLTALLDHGVPVPITVDAERDGSLPLLVGLHRLEGGHDAWQVLTKGQAPGWEQKVVDATVCWLAQGRGTTWLNMDHVADLVQWMAVEGIPMSAWQDALDPHSTTPRAMNLPRLETVLHQRLHTMVEKAVLHEIAQSVATPVIAKPRARL